MKRSVLFSGAGLLALAAALFFFVNSSSASKVVVYKSPTCLCCAKWVDHLENAGFDVEVHDTNEMQAVKVRHGIDGRLSSCHTALVNGYVIEGHVPAAQIVRLLAEQPENVRGLAAPGMPIGSPGMEGPGAEPYDVVAFDENRRTMVYATVDPNTPAVPSTGG